MDRVWFRTRFAPPIHPRQVYWSPGEIGLTSTREGCIPRRVVAAAYNQSVVATQEVPMLHAGKGTSSPEREGQSPLLPPPAATSSSASASASRMRPPDRSIDHAPPRLRQRHSETVYRPSWPLRHSFSNAVLPIPASPTFECSPRATTYQLANADRGSSGAITGGPWTPSDRAVPPASECTRVFHGADEPVSAS